MKKKIRELVVRISYSKYLDLVMSIVGIVIIILFFLTKTSSSKILIAHNICSIVLYLIVLIWECADTIKKTEPEVLEKNKIRNVVLSKGNMWTWILMWPTCLTISIIAFVILNIAINPISVLITCAIIVTILISLSRLISKIFKNKLIR